MVGFNPPTDAIGEFALVLIALCTKRASLLDDDTACMARVCVWFRSDGLLQVDFRPSNVVRLVNDCVITCFRAHYIFSTMLLVAPHLEALKTASPRITDREKAHIRAVLEFSSGNLPGAVDEWTDILVQNPRGVNCVDVLQ